MAPPRRCGRSFFTDLAHRVDKLEKLLLSSLQRPPGHWHVDTIDNAKSTILNSEKSLNIDASEFIPYALQSEPLELAHAHPEHLDVGHHRVLTGPQLCGSSEVAHLSESVAHPPSAVQSCVLHPSINDIDNGGLCNSEHCGSSEDLGLLEDSPRADGAGGAGRPECEGHCAVDFDPWNAISTLNLVQPWNVELLNSFIDGSIDIHGFAEVLTALVRDHDYFAPPRDVPASSALVIVDAEVGECTSGVDFAHVVESEHRLNDAEFTISKPGYKNLTDEHVAQLWNFIPESHRCHPADCDADTFKRVFGELLELSMKVVGSCSMADCEFLAAIACRTLVDAYDMVLPSLPDDCMYIPIIQKVADRVGDLWLEYQDDSDDQSEHDNNI